ncbi:MAG: hypothetical protein IMX02_08845 [Limnochordaceae bacterium]|nr:hypothetical protein [Limnochordaceae bacterium]
MMPYRLAGRCPWWLCVTLLAAAGLVMGIEQPCRALLRVTPLTVTAVVEHAGERVGPIFVGNRGEAPLPVRVGIAMLTHSPEGRPVVLEEPGHLARAQEYLGPEWTERVLGPGQQETLWLSVRRVPESAIYSAVLVQVPAPLGTFRVVVLVGVRRARPARGPQLSIEAVWAEQSREGDPVEIVARVRNDGGTDAEAVIESVITAESGPGAGRGPQAALLMGPATVYPGAVRLVRARWQPDLLPAGVYRVSASLAGTRGAGKAAGATASLTVDAPYRLAGVDGAVSLQLRPSRDGSMALVASVHNRSPHTLAPQLEWYIERDGARTAQDPVLLGPVDAEK